MLKLSRQPGRCNRMRRCVNWHSKKFLIFLLYPGPTCRASEDENECYVRNKVIFLG
jgi:hypothetical protein